MNAYHFYQFQMNLVKLGGFLFIIIEILLIILLILLIIHFCKKNKSK